MLKGQEKQKSYWSIRRKKNKPIVYNEDAKTVERDIGAGPFDRFDEMSTKKVRKSSKPSEETKIKNSKSSTEASKESQVAKKSNSGLFY